MQVYTLPRGSGKTETFISISHKTKNVIVCLDVREKQRIIKRAKELDADIPEPITFEKFLKGGSPGRIINGYLIDNADMLLQRIAMNTTVTAVTMSSI